MPPEAICHRRLRLWLVVMAPHRSSERWVGWLLWGRAREGLRPAQNRVRVLAEQGARPEGARHPVVLVCGASCCGIVWRHGLRAHYPKAPSRSGAAAASRGQRHEPGGCRRRAWLVDQQDQSH
jgi:hypothetical protein